MSTNAANVRVAVTGAISRAPLGTSAPTGTADPLASFEDLGYSSEDGVEITIPGDGDSTPIKAWQNGDTVRIVRTTSDDQPTWHFTLLETKLAAIEEYFGVTVSQSSAEGSFEHKVTAREHKAYVIDVVDGAELIRHFIPNGVVTEVGNQVFSNGAAIGYEITIAGDLDPTLGYDFKGWATALGHDHDDDSSSSSSSSSSS